MDRHGLHAFDYVGHDSPDRPNQSGVIGFGASA
jgi:hypothetical protein